MAKEVLLFNGAAIPAHLQKRMAEAPSNIEERISVPTLATAGKGAWAITLNGETTRLQKRDSEGDLVDMPMFRGIILDYAKRRGRTYYSGPYDEKKPGKPECWSEDGILPDPHATHPTNEETGEVVTKCGNCPLAVKGSKVNELGAATTACGEHRMVALIPHNKPDFTALRLKLSITSDFDGRSPELEAEDWYAFKNYTDMLRTRGVTNTAFVITKIKFDPNKKFPKLIFQWGGWVDEGVIEGILVRAAGDEVKGLLSADWGDSLPDTKKLEAPDAKPKTATPKPKAAANDDEGATLPKVSKRPPPPADDDDQPVKPKKKVVVDDDDDDQPVKPKKKVVVDDDDDDQPVKPKKKVVVDDDDAPQSKPFTDDDIELTTTPKAKKAEVEAAQAAKKKKAAAAEDDDGGGPELPTPGKKKPAETTAPKQTAKPVSGAMAGLMGKWNTEDDD